MQSGNCAFVTRNVEMRRECRWSISSLMAGYMMGSPTRLSAQCRACIPPHLPLPLLPCQTLHQGLLHSLQLSNLNPPSALPSDEAPLCPPHLSQNIALWGGCASSSALLCSPHLTLADSCAWVPKPYNMLPPSMERPRLAPEDRMRTLLQPRDYCFSPTLQPLNKYQVIQNPCHLATQQHRYGGLLKHVIP